MNTLTLNTEHVSTHVGLLVTKQVIQHSNQRVPAITRSHGSLNFAIIHLIGNLIFMDCVKLKRKVFAN